MAKLYFAKLKIQVYKNFYFYLYVKCLVAHRPMRPTLVTRKASPGVSGLSYQQFAHYPCHREGIILGFGATIQESILPLL
jgi:hypothetical protein